MPTQFQTNELSRDQQIKPPSKAKSFVDNFGFVIVLIALAGFYVPKTNGVPAPWWDFNTMLLFIGVVVAWYVLQKYVDKKVDEPTIKYVPYNAFKETKEIQEQFLKELGVRLTIQRWTPQPAYGKASSEAHTIHHIFDRTYTTGLVERGSMGMPLLWRNFPRFEPNHYHIEDFNREASGAIKFSSDAEIGFTAPSLVKVRPIQRLSSETTDEEPQKEDSGDEES